MWYVRGRGSVGVEAQDNGSSREAAVTPFLYILCYILRYIVRYVLRYILYILRALSPFLHSQLPLHSSLYTFSLPSPLCLPSLPMIQLILSSPRFLHTPVFCLPYKPGLSRESELVLYFVEIFTLFFFFLCLPLVLWRDSSFGFSCRRVKPVLSSHYRLVSKCYEWLLSHFAVIMVFWVVIMYVFSIWKYLTPSR